MNILSQCTIEYPQPHLMRIKRDPGLFYWLFVFIYTGFTSVLSALFAILIWEAQAPRKLICQTQDNAVNCEYQFPGLITPRTLQVPQVKNAIVSPKVQGDVVVLTSSEPWVALEITRAPALDVERINQALANLKQTQNRFELELYPSNSVRTFLLICIIPIGLLLGGGLWLVFRQGNSILELDANANTVSILRWGKFRTQLAQFNQLTGADNHVTGYLGALSDKFGVYRGDPKYRRWNHRTIRLLFTHRRPYIFHQEYFFLGDGQELVDEIQQFLEDTQP